MKAWRATYWPKEDPIGRAIRLGGSDGPRSDRGGGWLEMCTSSDSMLPARRQFFRPYTQAGWPVMNIVVRAINTRPALFAAPVKKSSGECSCPTGRSPASKTHGGHRPQLDWLATLSHASC